jgi:hypothetical protein
LGGPTPEQSNRSIFLIRASFEVAATGARFSQETSNILECGTIRKLI